MVKTRERSDVDFKAGSMGSAVLTGMNQFLARTVRSSGIVEHVYAHARESGSEWDVWAAENFATIVAQGDFQPAGPVKVAENPFSPTVFLWWAKLVVRVLRTTGVVKYLKEQAGETATEWDDWAVKAFDKVLTLIESA